MHSYKAHTDEQLLSLLQDSDEGAFTELYHRYWDKLLARGITQLKSVEDAEELLHDIFVRLWKRRDTIRIRHSFHTYIAAILKYEVLKKLADRKKVKLQDLSESQDSSLVDYSTQQRLDFLELQERLEASVKQLPEKCRLVFRLSREEGLSGKEIARELQITPKTVENHINRALRALRSSLNLFLTLFL